MKTKQIKKLLIASLLSSLLSFTYSCKLKDIKKVNIEYSEEMAKSISHITSGLIPSNIDLVVKFTQPMIDKSEVGKELDESTFYLEPYVKGKVTWKDEKTLVFKPEDELPLKKEFMGVVRVGKILDTNKFPALDEVPIAFRTFGREIAKLEGDFRLKQDDSPKEVFYQGEIDFNVKTNLDMLKSSIKLVSNEKEVPLTWEESKEHEAKFIFKSALLNRDSDIKRFTLKVNKEKLEITDEYSKSFNLENIDTMKVTEVDNIDLGEQNAFEIKFTDELDTQQNIDGFIKIDNLKDIRTKVSGNKIIVTGDFKHGKKYNLTVFQGINSKWNTKSTTEYKKEISFDDIKPQVMFSNDGVFLPSANNQKIYFKTMNLSKVKVEIKKVFESNLGFFLQTEKLQSLKSRTDYFDSYYTERIGVNVVEKALEIGEKKNSWLQHELDLKNLLPKGEKGLFLINITFEKEDMLYTFSEDKTQVYDGDDYYANPNSDGYLSYNASIYKALIMSDIGLSYKKGYKQHIIYANDIISSEPLKDVTINLRNYQNQIIATKNTDNEGRVAFEKLEGEVFYIEGEKRSQRSVIATGEMAWNLSNFDVGGEEFQPDGTRAFIYSERGVYRPGDEINLSVIARNDDNKFPDNHPLTLKLYNPMEQLVSEQVNKNGKDGFYNFNLKTNENDMTGNWRAEIIAGSRIFTHTLKIETVIPNRLKIKFEPEKKELNKEDTQLNLGIISNYLFGNPASNLEVEVNAVLKSIPKTFAKYTNYTFSNEAMDYKEFNNQILKGNLDSNGKVQVAWKLPKLSKIPSYVYANISTIVREKGGRDTTSNLIVPINPYSHYIGMEKPKTDYGYTKIGNDLKIKTVLLDTKGNPVQGKKLKYRIYKNSKSWWWEYDEKNNYQLHYKNDTQTELIKEGELISQETPVNIEFKPQENGEYLIETEDVSSPNGHTSGFFFSASYWGEGTSSKDEGVLTLKADKKTYKPNDKAIVSFPIPEKAAYLVSIEKANKVLKTFWYKPSSGQKEAKVEVPITPEMMPTAYFSVSVIQPHTQTVNDRPIRMYGVLPLNVEDPTTHQELEIKALKELKAKEKFDIEVQTKDSNKTQFTIAVVDEGLLDLTNYKTPNPWEAFYKKLRLGVTSYDLFSYIIGANKGDIFRTFSVGGDLEYRLNQQEMKKARRFKQVSMFKGPLETDEKGYAKVSFEMPEYLGSVKVMVVSANEKRYTAAEKAIPVKSELIMLPTIPRVLSPNDSITMPVTVFATKDDIKDVEVSVETEGPIFVQEAKSKNLTFEKAGDKDLAFKLGVKGEVGTGKIIIKAKSGNYTEISTTEINVRPSSPRIYSSQEKALEVNKNISLTFENKGIQGSNQATLTISKRPKLDISNKLAWLINYPYGCLEQTVSAVFPQLYLKNFITTTEKGQNKLDENINTAIKNLRKFQLGNGAFSTWAGQVEESRWATNYAGHFLISAQKLGYNVPDELLEKWQKYQKNQARITEQNLTERVYRLYLLALNGQAEFGAMNLLKENQLSKLNDTQKWLLAGAYKLAGLENVAKQIASSAGIQVKPYASMDETYGSSLRDQAIMLNVITLFDQNSLADKLYKQIVAELNSNEWFSTHTLGYSLMALGNYMKNKPEDFKTSGMLVGYIKTPDGKKKEFNTKDMKITFPLEDSLVGKNIEVFLDKKSNLRTAYVNFESNYLPLQSNEKDTKDNLEVQVAWLDENGKEIKPEAIKQGTAFYGHFKVNNLNAKNISDLALIQVIPSGWEIENTRISSEELPLWTSKYKLNREKYLDFRDDRIMWFFNMSNYDKSFDFIVKLNAVTKGKFTLPPTIAETMYSRDYKAIKQGKQIEVN